MTRRASATKEKQPARKVARRVGVNFPRCQFNRGRTKHTGGCEVRRAAKNLNSESQLSARDYLSVGTVAAIETFALMHSVFSLCGPRLVLYQFLV